MRTAAIAALPRPEYPRPQLVRDQWLNLNGRWSYKPDPDNLGLREGWYRDPVITTQTIVVPYPIESSASGITNTTPAAVHWYERLFDLPADFTSKKICLNFGAVDYAARVFINGEQVGEHIGGYTPFSLDVTHALIPGENRVTVQVTDSLAWTRPRGKQAGHTRWPIDYDSVTGIWQTVWLEPLPETSITHCYSSYDISDRLLTVIGLFSNTLCGSFTVELQSNGVSIAQGEARIDHRAEARVNLKVINPQLWSPDSPVLYDLLLSVTDDASHAKDSALSYAGLREIDVTDGQLRLNQEPLYVRGVLDQGYFPEGWYTAHSDADLKRDVELTLALGFNCARKHQKAEDPRYYYWADRLGLMVWAEMPSGKVFSTELINTVNTQWSDLIVRDRNHPCIIAWVPFNESWGVWHQAEREEQRALVDSIYYLTHSLDGSRPVIGNDGWEFSLGDLWTLHLYDSEDSLTSRIKKLIDEPGEVVAGGDGMRPRTGALKGANVAGLPILLTECGGVGFGQYGDADFSYGDLPKTAESYADALADIVAELHRAKQLQGFVWTQLTDVQQEVNGLLYFNREPKLSFEQYRRLFTNPE